MTTQNHDHIDRRLQLANSQFAHADDFAGQACQFAVLALDDVVFAWGHDLSRVGSFSLREKVPTWRSGKGAKRQPKRPVM